MDKASASNFASAPETKLARKASPVHVSGFCCANLKMPLRSCKFLTALAFFVVGEVLDERLANTFVLSTLL